MSVALGIVECVGAGINESCAARAARQWIGAEVEEREEIDENGAKLLDERRGEECSDVAAHAVECGLHRDEPKE
jgi:hypothetical protein